MADVKHNLLARAAAFVAWALVLLSTSIVANEHSDFSHYYLTVKLVESHLPDDAKKRKNILSRVFSGNHTAATLQIEIDIDSQTSMAPFNSTTVADAIELNTTRIAREKRKEYQLRDYVIVSDRRIYREDMVTLGFMYSAMLHDIDALEQAKGAFQLESNTYFGLASQALRVFTRVTETQVYGGTRYTAREIWQDATTDDDGRNTYCVILTPHKSKHPCEKVELNLPYVKLSLEVSHTVFTTNERDLLGDLHAYMKENHSDLRERILQAETIEELNWHCAELQDALHLDLVPDDRDLVLLGLLKEIKFDPAAMKIHNRCWSDREAALKLLSQRYRTLKLEACAALENDRSQQECRLVTKFMRRWLVGLGAPGGGDENKVSWSVTYPGDWKHGQGGLDNFLSRYRLELRYGNFERNQGLWTAAGSIYDVERECLFEAEIRISIVEEDGPPTMGSLQIYHDEGAKVGRPPTSVKKSSAWDSKTECPREEA